MKKTLLIATAACVLSAPSIAGPRVSGEIADREFSRSSGAYNTHATYEAIKRHTSGRATVKTKLKGVTLYVDRRSGAVTHTWVPHIIAPIPFNQLSKSEQRKVRQEYDRQQKQRKDQLDVCARGCSESEREKAQQRSQNRAKPDDPRGRRHG